MIRGSLLNGNNQVMDYDLSKLIQSFRTQGVVTGMDVTLNAVNPGYAFINVTRGTQTRLMLVEIQTTETISTSGTKKVWIDIDQTKVDSPASNPIDGTTIARIQTGASYPGTTHIKLASIASGAITDEREYSTFGLLAVLAQNQTFTGANVFANFPTKSGGLTASANAEFVTKKHVDDLLVAVIPFATNAEAVTGTATNKVINPKQLNDYAQRVIAGTTYTAASLAGGVHTNSSNAQLHSGTFKVCGTYRVEFKLRVDSGTKTANGRIYKNGVAYGTARSTSSTTDVTYTEDLVFDVNDVISFWGYEPSGANYYLSTMTIKYDLLTPAFTLT